MIGRLLTCRDYDVRFFAVQQIGKRNDAPSGCVDNRGVRHHAGKNNELKNDLNDATRPTSTLLPSPRINPHPYLPHLERCSRPNSPISGLKKTLEYDVIDSSSPRDPLLLGEAIESEESERRARAELHMLQSNTGVIS